MKENDIIVHKNSVFERVHGLYAGYSPMPIPEGNPWIEWTGGQIPWKMYCELCAFFKWALDETKGEAQARLAYNEQERTYRFVIYPQEESHSLSTEEIESHPDRDKENAILTQGYDLCGTFHHHCNASAFQSSQDKSDEELQTGLHITLGKLDKDVWDIHSRIVLKGYQYNTVYLSDWFEVPFKIPESADIDLHELITKHFLVRPKLESFPEEWKSRIIKKPAAKPARGITTGTAQPVKSGDDPSPGDPYTMVYARLIQLSEECNMDFSDMSDALQWEDAPLTKDIVKNGGDLAEFYDRTDAICALYDCDKDEISRICDVLTENYEPGTEEQYDFPVNNIQ